MIEKLDFVEVIRIGFKALIAPSFLIPAYEYTKLFYYGVGNGLATAENKFQKSTQRKIQTALTASFLPAILITFYDISNIGALIY